MGTFVSIVLVVGCCIFTGLMLVKLVKAIKERKAKKVEEVKPVEEEEGGK